MPKKVRSYLVAAAVIAAAVSASLLPALSAGASSAACGSACTSPSVKSLGTGEVLAVSGSSVVMSTATTSSTTDWTPEDEGSVGNAVGDEIVSPKLAWIYGSDTLVEFQYVPNGVPSDECLADTASVPLQGPAFYVPSLNVALTQCGVSAQSLWIIDANNLSSGYADLINAGYAASVTYDVPDNVPTSDYTGLFAEPAVLTVNSSGKVVLAPLSELGGVVSPSQMWTAWSAPAQPALRARVSALRAKFARSG